MRQMELPVNVSSAGSGAPAALPVFDKEHNFIGLMTNRGYSYEFRKVLGLATIDIHQTEIGNEVYILYGDEGKRQTMIRATVGETPYKCDRRK